MAARLDAQYIKNAAAQNGWLDILKSIAPSLEEATGKIGKHVPCPVNGGTDGFRLFMDAPVSGAGYSNKEGAFGDGFAVLQFATGLPFKEVLTLVAGYLGITEEKVLYAKPKPVMQSTAVSFEFSDKEILTRKSKLNRLWGQSSAINADDRVAQYLHSSRGIQGGWISKVAAIRLHPNAWYRDVNGNQASAPAMLLRFQCPNGTPCNIHKTFLSSETDGKAEMNDPKLMMKPSCKMRGGAVRIGDIEAIVRHDGVLHVSEGFENAATIADVFEQPSWATLNCALLQGFVPPQEAKILVIWADNDPLDDKGHNVGVDAAHKLQSKLAESRPDLQVNVKIPPNKKEDWNDLYKMGRMDLFSLESK
jgi:putative DNA primase/helicase